MLYKTWCEMHESVKCKSTDEMLRITLLSCLLVASFGLISGDLCISNVIDFSNAIIDACKPENSIIESAESFSKCLQRNHNARTLSILKGSRDECSKSLSPIYNAREPAREIFKKMKLKCTKVFEESNEPSYYLNINEIVNKLVRLFDGKPKIFENLLELVGGLLNFVLRLIGLNHKIAIGELIKKWIEKDVTTLGQELDAIIREVGNPKWKCDILTESDCRDVNDNFEKMKKAINVNLAAYKNCITRIDC